MSDFTLVSTTDSPADIEAAAAARAAAAKPAETAPPPAETPAPASEPVAEPTDEEKERAAASDAAKILAERKSKAKEREGSIQANIDRLKYEEAEALRRVAALKAEADRVSAEKPAEPVAFDPGPKPQITNAAAPGYRADYDTFVEDLADWKASIKAQEIGAKVKAEFEATLKARDEQSQQAAQQTTQQTQWDLAQKAAIDRWKAYEAKQPDFKELMASVEHDADYAMTEDMIVHLTVSEFGPELAYELAKMDPKQFAEIRSLPPRALATRLGRMEGAMLSRQTVAPPTGPTATAPSKLPPPPPKPVGGGGSASTKPLDQVPYEEYKRRRMAGEGR